MSRSSVSRMERGVARGVSMLSLERVATALGARLELSLRWNGDGLDRLLDEDHAFLVDETVRLLRRAGWEVLTEVSFNVRGERGSVDVFGRHSATSVLLVVEVKSVVPDVQAMLFALDRKARLGLQIGEERGWPGRAVGRLLVVGRSATTYRRIARHAATFDAALPTRNAEARRWLSAPADPAIAGILFVSPGRMSGVRKTRGGRERVRLPAHPTRPWPVSTQLPAGGAAGASTPTAGPSDAANDHMLLG